MELTFKDLRKREVINVVDGQSFGKVVDLTLDFPKGILIGISVPAKRRGGLFCLFDRSTIYIDQRKIIKIGSDVILVNIGCAHLGEGISLGEKKTEKKKICPNPCPPPCEPNHSSSHPQEYREKPCQEFTIFGNICSEDDE